MYAYFRSCMCNSDLVLISEINDTFASRYFFIKNGVILLNMYLLRPKDNIWPWHSCSWWVFVNFWPQLLLTFCCAVLMFKGWLYRLSFTHKNWQKTTMNQITPCCYCPDNPSQLLLLYYFIFLALIVSSRNIYFQKSVQIRARFGWKSSSKPEP